MGYPTGREKNGKIIRRVEKEEFLWETAELKTLQEIYWQDCGIVFQRFFCHL